ncbi:hypothetical protein GPM19_09790 [Halomonas sp. ZH2S]|uniref:Uncharacterized protein n=1 Tax=Vreelandella zhuhanensis TaxID=2684210 RepID=A0A7X3H2L7_9GAMM|nr:hypothetical protein [Halomonas zhuhanensis]MWJ28493.1 hypothetical protein [Halomonas zhuhanensis]
MEIVSTAWHVIVAFSVFVIGALLMILLARCFSVGSLRSLGLYCWHTIFCLFYLWFVLRFGGDAVAYFRKASEGEVVFSFGTAGVDYFTAFLVQGVGVSILGAFLIFNIFGSIGLLALNGSLKVATRNAKPYVIKLATVIVFLPSVSFWSSAIGKDSLSFMATGLALWAALDLGKRGLLMAIAIVVMLMVRPHMAGIMVMGLALAVMFDSNMTLGKRLICGIGAISIAGMLVPFALQYAGVGETVSVDSLNAYIDKRQSYNMEGGGGVDISSMSLPVQLFTYMFRPTFLEINSIFSVAAALDNAILLYLFVFGGWVLFKCRVRSVGNRVFMWAYVLVAWIILSMVTANLGIALRQKWMFAPMLIFLLLSVIGKKQCTTPPILSLSKSDDSELK